LADKPINILLIEDNSGDRRLISEMLTEASTDETGVAFDIQYADRLQAAIEYLGQNRVEAILLDLGLPDSKGLDTLKRVYAEVPELPIVVLTGLNDELIGVQAVNEGAQDYLIKGQVDTHLLRRTIRYAIERKQAEERERRLQLQLNLSTRLASLGLMVEGIAHEVNNPLSSVIGFAQMLTCEDIPENTKDDIKMINDNAQRVADIMNNLLTFARQQKLQRTYINVNDIIRATLQMRAHSLESNNITVTTELDSTLPSTMADATLLQQAFLNLIINAVIHLFDPFFSTRGVGQGAGLGLSVCYGIINEHNGQIYVQSQPGKGAVFTVELPVVGEEKHVEVA